MTLKQAVKILGGASAAAKASGIGRTVIIYWMKQGVPHFRQTDKEKIILLAEQARKEAS
jgi:predicted peroxiredoxin